MALTILAAVGTTLIPLLNALFAPRKPAGPRAADHGVAAAPAWPTYADGRTPLPVLPDGSPDWNAYYTGHPSAQPPQAPQQALPAPPAPQPFPVAPFPTAPEPYSQTQPAPPVPRAPAAYPPAPPFPPQ